MLIITHALGRAALLGALLLIASLEGCGSHGEPPPTDGSPTPAPDGSAPPPSDEGATSASGASAPACRPMAAEECPGFGPGRCDVLSQGGAALHPAVCSAPEPGCRFALTAGGCPTADASMDIWCCP